DVLRIGPVALAPGIDVAVGFGGRARLGLLAERARDVVGGGGLAADERERDARDCSCDDDQSRQATLLIRITKHYSWPAGLLLAKKSLQLNPKFGLRRARLRPENVAIAA